MWLRVGSVCAAPDGVDHGCYQHFHVVQCSARFDMLDDHVCQLSRDCLLRAD
jgi:hypothetical protein